MTYRPSNRWRISWFLALLVLWIPSELFLRWTCKAARKHPPFFTVGALHLLQKLSLAFLSFESGNIKQIYTFKKKMNVENIPFFKDMSRQKAVALEWVNHMFRFKTCIIFAVKSCLILNIIDSEDLFR